MEKAKPGMEEILKAIAPCGIDCSRCVQYKAGDVVRLSSELKSRLEGFENMAERTKDMVPVMKKYPDFFEMLEHFSKGNCPGCRDGESPNCMCAARECHKEKGVDFCFQCEEYPCERNKFNPQLKERWLRNNDFMKKEGVEAFFLMQGSKPRY